MSSKYLGVSWNAMSKAWKAEMTHIKKHGGDGTRKFLGLYDDERSAAIAVDAFVRERMPGLTAKLNFPDMDPRDLERELAQAKERQQRRQRSRPGTAIHSKFLGVSWNATREAWQAQMYHGKKHGGDGKNHHLGHYDDERSAAIAVDSFIRERMPGLVSKLNFPDMDPRDLARELAQVKPRERGRAKSHACGQSRICPFERGTKREAEVPPSTDPEATIAAPVEGPPKRKCGLPEGAPTVSGEGRAESEATVAAQRKPAAKRPRTRPTPKPAEESRRPEKKTPTLHTEAVDGHLVVASAVPL